MKCHVIRTKKFYFVKQNILLLAKTNHNSVIAKYKFFIEKRDKLKKLMSM